jgi:CHAD domain-containing protein
VPQVPKRLLAERIRAFFRHLPHALAGQPEGIHQMRVAGRRLRVTLPLVARKPAGGRVRRARRTLKRLIRAAAGGRDLDVGLELFDEQVVAADGASREAEALRRGLGGARTRGRRRMREAILDADIAGLRRDLRALVASVEAAESVVLARVRQARDVDGEALLARLETLGDTFDGEALHDVRRRARRLRYVGEAAAEVGGETGTAPKRLKQLQEHLGGIHDAGVLAGWLARQAVAADRRGAGERAAEARRLEAACVELSRARHRAYLGTDPVGTLKQALVLFAPAPSPPWQESA